MKTGYGTCKFCRQLRTVQYGEDKGYTQAELDQIATDECDCDGARMERDIQNLIDEGTDGLRLQLMSRGMKSACNALLPCVPLIVRGPEEMRLMIRLDSRKMLTMRVVTMEKHRHFLVQVDDKKTYSSLDPADAEEMEADLKEMEEEGYSGEDAVTKNMEREMIAGTEEA